MDQSLSADIAITRGAFNAYAIIAGLRKQRPYLTHADTPDGRDLVDGLARAQAELNGLRLTAQLYLARHCPAGAVEAATRHPRLRLGVDEEADEVGLRRLARETLGEVDAPAEVLALPSLSLKEKIEARAASAATPEDAARLRRLAASLRPQPAA